jgi:hypothetical protein
LRELENKAERLATNGYSATLGISIVNFILNELSYEMLGRRLTLDSSSLLVGILASNDDLISLFDAVQRELKRLLRNSYQLFSPGFNSTAE